MMIQISTTALIFLKSKSPIEKALSTKVEGFQMSLFELSETYQKAVTENCQIWNFPGTSSVYHFVKIFRQALNL